MIIYSLTQYYIILLDSAPGGTRRKPSRRGTRPWRTRRSASWRAIPIYVLCIHTCVYTYIYIYVYIHVIIMIMIISMIIVMIIVIIIIMIIIIIIVIIIIMIIIIATIITNTTKYVYAF